MSVAKVIEVSASSTTSFDDAVKQGVAEVSKTVKNVQGAWINEQNVIVKDGKVAEYRVNMKVTFVVN